MVSCIYSYKPIKVLEERWVAWGYYPVHLVHKELFCCFECGFVYPNLNPHCIGFDWAVNNPFPLCHWWFVSLIYILLWRSSSQEKDPTLYRSCSSFLPCFGFCVLLVAFKVWEFLRFILFQNHSLSSSFLVAYWIPILNGYATMGSFLHGDCQLQAH